MPATMEAKLSDTDIQFVSPRRAADLTSLSTRHIARLVETKRFPAPIKLGEGKNGRLAFVESEVKSWLRARITERDGATA